MSKMHASVLVVDDQEINRDLLARRLERDGYLVSDAEGGQQALSMIDAQAFDVVLLDIMMPGIDGIEVLSTLRQSRSSVDLPVIMVSAKQDSENVVESLCLGANDYVSKPVDYPILRARVEAQVARKRAEEELLKLNQVLEEKVKERTVQYQETFTSLREEIAERIKTEQAVLIREQKFRDFSEVASDWFWETDPQHRLSFVSERVSEMLGVRPEEAIGKTVWELMDAGIERNEIWRDFVSRLDALTPFRNARYKFTDSDGNLRHVCISGKPVYDDAGAFQGFRGVTNDETSEMQARERIHEAESQLVGITKNLPGIIYRKILKSDGSYDYPFISAGTYELIGIDEEEIAAGDFFSLLSIYGDDVKHYQAAMELSSKNLSPIDIEYRIVPRSGALKWIHCTAYPQRLDTGEIAWDGLLLDITERKNLEAQLIQAQKLESVGQLAAGIAHEINTPTQYVNDNISFLQEAFGDLGQVLELNSRLLDAARENSVTLDLVAEVDAAVKNADVEYLAEEVPVAIEQAMEGVQRISVIVKAMKQFTHPGKEDKEPVDVNQLIENTVTVARNEWKYVARVESDCSENLPLVPCYRNELGQVFLNIIVNAAHAIADAKEDGSDSQGIISISTRQANNEVLIRISDTGPGIPDSLRTKIFDPFFTTKEVGKGTGQGLAIARSVVIDKHQGKLELESESGKGATFVIRLPLGEETGTNDMFAE